LFLNREPVTEEQLAQALAAFHAANPDGAVFINGDAKAQLGGAIAVLDEIRALGITKVAIETRPRAATP
jgi:biopolymer transport protein ExbD